MTHDELLAEIDSYAYVYKPKTALRKVVELHKPVMAFTGGYDGEENELWEEQCQECSGNGFSQIYPCPTIKDIEKELG
jgi:hypothetical protein